MPSSTSQNAEGESRLPFLVCSEYFDEDGIWNPRHTEPPLEAAFQVNVFGSRAEYLRLAEFFRAFAEQDTSRDGDYHEHFEGLTSLDGKVRLHVILRKDDVGDATWKSLLDTPNEHHVA
jgi:hypothetical protein